MRVWLILTPLFVLFLLAFLSLFLSPYNASLADISSLYNPPNLKHFFGTDNLGRDLFTRLFSGLFTSTFIGIFGSGLTLLLALAYVFLARLCFYNVFMRLLDMLLALPSLILMMFFQSFFGGSIFIMIILIALTHFAFVAKVLDSELKRLGSLDFYTAALMLGSTKIKAFFSELMPGLYWLLAVFFVLNFIHAISMEAILSFFSLGLSLEIASLGNVLNDASRGLFLGAWWSLVFPLIILLMLVLPLLNLSNYWQEKYGVKL